MGLSVIKNTNSLKVVHNARGFSSAQKLQVAYRKVETPVIKLTFC
ncbi:hypothetical protein [Patiriisocius marinus]|nr:hypothetical protein [Patiriisocius marinus]